MPAGIRIMNDTFALIIDERFFNYAFVSKHTLTFSSGNSSGLWTGGNTASAVLTLSGADNPIVAARSDKGWVLAAAGKVGNNWVFHFAGGMALGTAGPGDQIEVFVFDRPRVISGSGVGLRVWDEASRPVFDSRQQYMRVLDYREFNAATGGTFSIAGNHAQVVTTNAYSKSLAPTIPEYGNWVIRVGFLHSVTGGYTATLLNYAEGNYNPNLPPPFSVSISQTMRVMTVDVSGY